MHPGHSYDRQRISLEERLARPAPAVWLSGKQAAEYVGASGPTLRQATLEHQIPHVRLGILLKIDVTALDEHLRHLARTQAQASESTAPVTPTPRSPQHGGLQRCRA